MQNLMSRFIKDESGATAIEYGLIAALIGVSIIVGGRAVGEALNDKYELIATTVEGAGIADGAG